MHIQMPILFGVSSFAVLFSKVEKAIENSDFPIELDCNDIKLVTSAFYNFAAGVLKRVGKENRDKVILINVGKNSLRFIRDCKFDKVIKIRLKEDG